MLQSEQEQTLIDVLALIYDRIPWGSMSTSKNPHDIFNHRVRAAARRSNMYEFASKLCNYFGLQSMPVEAQLKADALRPYEREVLNTISREHIPLCVRATIQAKQVRTERKIKKEESSGTIGGETMGWMDVSKDYPPSWR